MALALILAAALVAPPTPVACARPNAAATVLHAEEPDVPPMAQQQGIAGTVVVFVTLDEHSHLTSARVERSPSAILNNAALNVARYSAFRTEIRDCKPIAATYRLAVDFPNEASEPQYPYIDTSSPSLIVARGEARITLPVSAIVLRVRFSATGASAAAAADAADAAYETFQKKLAALPAPLSVPSAQYYDVLPADLPSQGFVASRGIAMTVSRNTALRDLLGVADASGATSATIAYLADERPAEVAAGAALALRAAQQDARVLAGRRGRRLGALFDSKTEVSQYFMPVRALLGAPLGRGEVPAVPANRDVILSVVARFALQP